MGGQGLWESVFSHKQLLGKKEKSSHLKMFMKYGLSPIRERSFETLFSFSIVDGKMSLKQFKAASPVPINWIVIKKKPAINGDTFIESTTTAHLLSSRELGKKTPKTFKINCSYCWMSINLRIYKLPRGFSCEGSCVNHAVAWESSPTLQVWNCKRSKEAFKMLLEFLKRKVKWKTTQQKIVNKQA